MFERLTMRRCHQVAKVLQSYLDGEIDARTAKRVHDHLEVCRRCGMEASTYQAIKDAVPASVATGDTATVDPDALARLRDFTNRLAASGD